MTKHPALFALLFLSILGCDAPESDVGLPGFRDITPRACMSWDYDDVYVEDACWAGDIFLCKAGEFLDGYGVSVCCDEAGCDMKQSCLIDEVPICDTLPFAMPVMQVCAGGGSIYQEHDVACDAGYEHVCYEGAFVAGAAESICCDQEIADQCVTVTKAEPCPQSASWRACDVEE